MLNSELIRYKRQIMIPEIGKDGQRKIKNSKVLIIGAGGLGSPIALYLAATGIGVIGLVDDDCIDLSNLQRQILHSTSRIGMKKVESGKMILEDLNPNTIVEIYPLKISEDNIEEIIKTYDIVVNAVDNTETRYLLNKACHDMNKVLIEGAIHNFQGHVFTIIPGESACYECVFPKNNKQKEEKKEIGVIGVLPGVIGALQAMEVVKYILGKGKLLIDKILYYDALNASFREYQIEKDCKCKVCGKKENDNVS